MDTATRIKFKGSAHRHLSTVTCFPRNAPSYIHLHDELTPCMTHRIETKVVQSSCGSYPTVSAVCHRPRGIWLISLCDSLRTLLSCKRQPICFSADNRSGVLFRPYRWCPRDSSLRTNHYFRTLRNAPEMRCYVEAQNKLAAMELLRTSLDKVALRAQNQTTYS